MINEYQKQERMTHSDTLKYQERLTRLFRRKMKYPILSFEEKRELPSLVANSLLGQGLKIPFLVQVPGAMLHFGSVHTMLLKMQDYGTAQSFTFFQHYQWWTLSTQSIWKALYNKCLEIFPLVLGEALARSREMTKREESKSYGFKPGEKLE